MMNNLRSSKYGVMEEVRQFLEWTIFETLILKRVSKTTEIIKSIRERKKYSRQVMKGPKYRLLQNIMQGKIASKRSSELEKIKIAVMYTNVLRGDGT